MSSTQTNPNKHSVIIFSCKDIVSSRTPDINPDCISLWQFDHAADTGHLATFLRQGGVIQRHYFLSIFVYSTLSTPIDRCMHSEVIEAIQGAGEDAGAGTVASSLVDQHSAKLQDSRVAGVAVFNVQLGCEGHSAYRTYRNDCIYTVIVLTQDDNIFPLNTASACSCTITGDFHNNWAAWLWLKMGLLYKMLADLS